MAATTTTTIRGVSLATPPGRTRDVFDLALSLDGMEIRRPGRPAQHLPWSRISKWEIEEGPNDVLLTLHGGGATTPLVIPGWTPDDLEILMRDVTADSPGPDSALRVMGVAPAPVPVAEPARPSGTPDDASAAPSSRSGRRRGRVRWRTVVTVVLLGALAAAVTLVLLQSAGLISWSFLGPTA